MRGREVLGKMVGATLIILLSVGCSLVGDTPTPPLSKLYLCDGPLKRYEFQGIIVTHYLQPAGKENATVSFGHELEGPIPRGRYEIALNLAAGEEDAGDFEISLVHRNEDADVVLGRTVIQVASADFERFTRRVVGKAADAQVGDQLMLVVKNLSNHKTEIQCGESYHGQCYVMVPW